MFYTSGMALRNWFIFRSCKICGGVTYAYFILTYYYGVHLYVLVDFFMIPLDCLSPFPLEYVIDRFYLFFDCLFEAYYLLQFIFFLSLL